MDAAQFSPLLLIPTSPTARSSRWEYERVADLRLARVWKRLADLRAAGVMVVTVVREFLHWHIDPLQRHSRLMWTFTRPKDPMQLNTGRLPPEVLSGVLLILTGEEVDEPAEAGHPLYCYRNKVVMAGAMPHFD